jgi:hypothetical protein
MEKILIRDPVINIPDPQHWFFGSVTEANADSRPLQRYCRWLIKNDVSSAHEFAIQELGVGGRAFSLRDLAMAVDNRETHLPLIQVGTRYPVPYCNVFTGTGTVIDNGNLMRKHKIKRQTDLDRHDPRLWFKIYCERFPPSRRFNIFLENRENFDFYSQHRLHGFYLFSSVVDA